MATITAGRGGPDPGDASGVSASGAPASHPYTCNTCHVAFRNIDLQKNHMKGDWHRYNLKRRVASLPPISSEIFNEKVLQARAATTAQADKVGFERACEVCQKTYYSENSFQNHIGSQKHKAREAARGAKDGRAFDEASSVISSTFSLGEPIPDNSNKSKVDLDSDVEEEFSQMVEGLKTTKINGSEERTSPLKRPSNPHLSKSEHTSSNQADEDSGTATPVESTKPEAAPPNNIKACLFCNYESPTSRLNATHMERIHGMFIPEKDYLVNLDGLIEALEHRVRELNECLYCGKVKANVFAVQTHMRDTSHCKIPFSTEDEQLEIGEFYDFRSTYSDGEGSDTEDEDDVPRSGGAKLGAKRITTVKGEDGDEVMEDGDGWETDSSASSLDSENLTAVPAEKHYHQYERLERHPHHSTNDPRGHHQKDGWHSHAHKHTHAAFYDEYELHLPNGKHVGHRAHNRYYRQNLRDRPVTEEERAERLALEQGRAGSPDEMDVDGLNRLARRNGSNYRALITRATGGQALAGVSKVKIKEVQRSEQRGRKAEGHHRGRMEWKTNKAANHQEHFHYSKLGG
ncbi:hypothetical protein PspLS_06108 [Pyricularia sp. CBS 133598]|nr:hypothetical protein PspLS_06108 [Pyricularia sp. CBS 133598]